MKQRAVSILAVALPVLLASTADAQQETVERRIRENRERLTTIRRERAELEEQLDGLRARAHDLEGELHNLERQKRVTARIVNELDRQIRMLARQLDTVSLDLVLTQEAHAEKIAVLRRRLVEIYKRGPLWTFQVLLSAESFGDLLSRYKYLYLVSRQDRALVREVEELEQRVVRQRQQLLAIQRELVARRDDRGSELERYLALERQRQRSLQEARRSQRRTASRLDSLERAEQQLSNLIAALERERRAGGAAALGTGTISEGDLGNLEWPAEGRLLYRYGRAQGPDETSIRHQGIGIAVPVGTPVHVVADGTVAIAQPLDTWGPTVIVNHGGGFYTVYAYLSHLDVARGEPVTRGQRIGLSGGVGTEDGPHIEFQIRQGQGGMPMALDPLNWLRRR